MFDSELIDLPDFVLVGGDDGFFAKFGLNVGPDAVAGFFDGLEETAGGLGDGFEVADESGGVGVGAGVGGGVGAGVGGGRGVGVGLGVGYGDGAGPGPGGGAGPGPLSTCRCAASGPAGGCR